MSYGVITSGSLELFMIRHRIQAGPLGCEHIGTPILYNGRLPTNNSIEIIYFRVNIREHDEINAFTGLLSKYFDWLKKPIDDKDTYRHALARITEHHAIPENRRDLFVRAIETYFEWLKKSIDDKDTYRHALARITEHHAIPENRRDLFVRAIETLAHDAKSPSPTLLFTALGNSLSEKPDAIVTEATPDFGRSGDFPKTAPEKWIPGGREPPEEFAVRVYGKWMKPDNTGISRGDILRLDPSLYNALRRSKRDTMPDGFFLPNRQERGTAELQWREKLQLPPPPDYNERRRLEALKRRRKITKSQMIPD